METTGSTEACEVLVWLNLEGVFIHWTGLDWIGLHGVTKIITAHAQSRYMYGSSNCCHRSLTSLLCWLSEPLPPSPLASFSVLIL